MKKSNLFLGGATLVTIGASSPHNFQLKNKGEIVTESHEKVIHHGHPVEESEITIDLSKVISLYNISGYSVYGFRDETFIWTHKKSL